MTSTLEREEVLERLRSRYERRNKEGRSRTLNEFCERHSYDRKRAVMLLGDSLPANKGTLPPTATLERKERIQIKNEYHAESGAAVRCRAVGHGAKLIWSCPSLGRATQCPIYHRSRLLQRLTHDHVAAPEDGRTPSESCLIPMCVFRQALRESVSRTVVKRRNRTIASAVFFINVRSGLVSMVFAGSGSGDRSPG